MLENLFAIFLLSGTFKDYFLYYHLKLPIDFTLLSVIVSFVFLTIRIISRKGLKVNLSLRNRLVIISFLLFWLWMIISLSYSPSPKYSYAKTFLFSTNFVTIIIVAFGNLDVRKFIKYFIYYTYLFLFFYFPVLIATQMRIIPYSSLNSLGGLYLTLGLNLGIIVLILKFSHSKIFNPNIDNFVFYSSFILLVLIGARGPLLFTLFVFILYYLSRLTKLRKVNLKFSLKKVIIGGFSITSLIVLIIVYHDKIKALFDRSLMRLTLILANNKGSSINARVEHLKKSFHLLQDPIILIKGIGIGSYMFVTQNIDMRGYPHNILLEVWVELGLIGLILFMMTFFSFISVGRISGYISKLLLLYLALNLLTTSSLVDIRLTVGFFMLFIEYQSSSTYSNENNLTQPA
jgi:hypothetical protein